MTEQQASYDATGANADAPNLVPRGACICEGKGPAPTNVHCPIHGDRGLLAHPPEGGSNAAHSMGIGEIIIAMKSTICQDEARVRLAALLAQLDDAAQDVQLKIDAVRRTIKEAGWEPALPPVSEADAIAAERRRIADARDKRRDRQGRQE